MLKNISIFKSLEKSSKPIEQKSISEVLDIIKDHPHKARIIEAKTPIGEGGKNAEAVQKYKGYSKSRGTYKRNLYDYVKAVECPSVTWNAVIDKQRLVHNIKETTGYIYGDIDNFDKVGDKYNCTNDEAKKKVKEILTSRSLPFVKAVWSSFGGNGFGFLMKVDKLTIKNFSSTWASLEKLLANFGLTLDPSTKDITRVNVLSYDPEIFIRDCEFIKPYMAVEPEQKTVQNVKVVAMPKGLIVDALQYKLDKLYGDDKYWEIENGQRIRLYHDFYFHFFCFAINKSIESETALEFLHSKVGSYIALFKGRYDVDGVVAIKEKADHYYGENGLTPQWGEYQVPITQEKEKEFVVTEIHKHYGGDVQIKLEHILFNLRNKDYDSSKKLKIFATIAKETGISKEIFVNFLCDIKQTPDGDDMSIILEVYGNTNIQYGLVKTLTSEAHQTAKDVFYENAAKNNLQIIERDRYEGNVAKKMDEILGFAKTCHSKLSSENLFSFLGLIFNKSKEFAITSSEALDFIISEYHISEDMLENLKKSTLPSKVKAKVDLHKQVIRYATYLVSEVYNYHPWKFGLQTRKTLSLKQVKENYNITQEYYLDKGQHISDLNLTDIDNKIIWGNTSQGKTTWICEYREGKRLVLVPIIPLLVGIQHTHNASVFYKDTKDVKEGDDLIVCTYSSFPTLLKIMSKWSKVKLSDYQLFFDEYHNFAVSSDKKFRGYELNCIADNMHLFKSRTMLTGTMFPILCPLFDKFEIFRVNWKVIPEKKFKRTRYTNLMYAVEKQLSRNGKNIIYLQNKKGEGKLGELIDYLVMKGWNEDKIWKINADEKQSDHFVRLMKNKWIDDDIEIVICTSVIVEGVDINNPDIASIHFMTHEGLINCEQLVNRFRTMYNGDENDCMIYSYKKIDDKPQELSDQVDVVQIQKNLISMAEEQLNYFSHAYVTGDSVSHKISQTLFVQNLYKSSGFYRNVDGIWEIDYFSIANMAYNEEKIYAAKDLDFTKMMLSEYNWTFQGENVIVEDLSDLTKGVLNDNKKNRKEMVIEEVSKILNEIHKEGEDVCEEKIAECNRHKLEQTEYPQHEIGLRSKVKWLCQNMTFDDSCNLVQSWIQTHSLSDQRWSKIRRQINVHLALKMQKMGLFENRYDTSTDFAKEIFKYFIKHKKEEKKNGKYLLTSTQILLIVKNRAKFSPELLNVKISEDYALKILKQYIDITEQVVNDKVKYYLSGINIDNDVVTFSMKLEEWAEDIKRQGIGLSSQELADKLNEIRSELPLLSMYKLNSKNAMNLIQDYYQFDRVSRRLVNGKKVNIYQIGSLFPVEISEVTIRPLLKIDFADKHQDDMTFDEKKLFNQQTKLNNITYYLKMNDLVPC